MNDLYVGTSSYEIDPNDFDQIKGCADWVRELVLNLDAQKAK